MDAHELFHQLTRGVRFVKRQSKSGDGQSSSVAKNSKDGDDSNEVVGPEGTSLDLKKQSNPSKILEGETEIDEGFEFLSGNCTTKEMPKKKRKLFTGDEVNRNLEEESVRKCRKENRISVLGKDIPAPIESFEDLRSHYMVSERLIENLMACKYAKPTPIQMQAIPIMLKGRPLMACAPTGSGKTIAYLAPIINDLRAPKKVGFRALVLAPTRELSKQIYRECVRLSEKTALKVHFISKANQVETKFGASSSKKFDILISTPNRVRYLLQQEPPQLDLKSVEWFVLDEADRLMEDGQNNFKEQLDDILVACTNSKKKLALFSATYTVSVAKWALKNLKNLARVTVGVQNSATEFVEQELLFVGSESGKLLAIRDLVRTGLKPPVLLFVQSKDRAKQLFEELLYDGINVDVIHADRTQQQRDNCVRAFREGHIWVLICTELMSRGIDFKGVNLVINYDFPPSTISYIHRIGRTGRAGRPGRAITFFTHDDTAQLRSIAEIIKNSGGKVPDFMLNMKKMRKSEKKKLANFAPKREDITTKMRPQSECPERIRDSGKVTETKKQESQTERKNNKLQKLKKRASNAKHQEGYNIDKKRIKIEKQSSKFQLL